MTRWSCFYEQPSTTKLKKLQGMLTGNRANLFFFYSQWSSYMPTYGLLLLVLAQLLRCSMHARNRWKHLLFCFEMTTDAVLEHSTLKPIFIWFCFQTFSCKQTDKQKSCFFTEKTSAWMGPEGARPPPDTHTHTLLYTKFWWPIPGQKSNHFLSHTCWNECSVEHVNCDTEIWRMWQSQASHSEHFSPALFSCTEEEKVFYILMRISDLKVTRWVIHY